MAIKFNLHETPQPHSRGKKALNHARAIPRSTKRMDDICRIICERASVSSADVKAVLDSFVWYIETTLADGDHVELEDLGYFSPSLRTRNTSEDEFVVIPDGINFRCSEKLKRKLSYTTLERAQETVTYTAGKRKERLIDHFENNESITTPQYMQLNVCSHYKATADLKQFIAEGWLSRIGSSTHVMYKLVETDTTI